MLIEALIFLPLAMGVDSIQMALFRGVIFVAIDYLVRAHMQVASSKNPDTRVDQPCPTGSVKGANGECRIESDLYGPYT